MGGSLSLTASKSLVAGQEFVLGRNRDGQIELTEHGSPRMDESRSRGQDRGGLRLFLIGKSAGARDLAHHPECPGTAEREHRRRPYRTRKGRF